MITSLNWENIHNYIFQHIADSATLYLLFDRLHGTWFSIVYVHESTPFHIKLFQRANWKNLLLPQNSRNVAAVGIDYSTELLVRHLEASMYWLFVFTTSLTVVAARKFCHLPVGAAWLCFHFYWTPEERITSEACTLRCSMQKGGGWRGGGGEGWNAIRYQILDPIKNIRYHTP